MKPILSVLIPTVPIRAAKTAALIEKLTSQRGHDKAEILWFGDNRMRSIGEKRNALLQAAKGKYVAFCDDDDGVSDFYVETLTSIGERNTVDVISFKQSAIWDGMKSEVVFSIHNQDERFNPGGITKRFPWHVCAWRRELAQDGVFADKNAGEDAAWVQQMKPLARREAHVPDVLHFYEHGEHSIAPTFDL
jgi:glycosyltransferase involved in cell wall biosynthesis